MGDFGSHKKKVGLWSISNVFFSRIFLVMGLSLVLGDFNDFLKMFSM